MLGGSGLGPPPAPPGNAWAACTQPRLTPADARSWPRTQPQQPPQPCWRPGPRLEAAHPCLELGKLEIRHKAGGKAHAKHTSSRPPLSPRDIAIPVQRRCVLGNPHAKHTASRPPLFPAGLAPRTLNPWPVLVPVSAAPVAVGEARLKRPPPGHRAPTPRTPRPPLPARRGPRKPRQTHRWGGRGEALDSREAPMTANEFQQRHIFPARGDSRLSRSAPGAPGARSAYRHLIHFMGAGTTQQQQQQQQQQRSHDSRRGDH